jgi:DNA-binding CsgD family transcriptional regulator
MPQGMVEVSASVVRGMLDMARSASLPLEPLVDALPFDLDSIERLRNVSWDDYCVVVERFEEACGGPEGLVATTAKHHRAILAPELRSMIGALVSPEALLRFVIRTLCPHTFPTVDFDYVRQPDGRFLVSGRLRPRARPCGAWFRGSVPYVQHLTEHLGLPPAEVEILQSTDHSLVFLIRLPPSRTVAARAEGGARTAFTASLRVMRRLAAEARQRSVELLTVQAKFDDVGALGRNLARHLDLDALAAEIGEALSKQGWNRIALSVAALDDKSAPFVHTRGGEGPFEQTLELVVADRSVGCLELAGSGDTRLLEELLPWLAICLDNARTVSAIGKRAPEDSERIAKRLGELERSHGFKPRQIDVLARIVRGYSNKEIAADLACAENTVEYHLTQLLRRTATSGRTQLAAWFWSGCA